MLSPGGFTLIEILVVITIMGLALGLTANFIPRRNIRLELVQASELVAGALRGARARALTTAQPVTVEASAEGLRIDGGLRSLPAGVRLAPATLRFRPDGSATAALLKLFAPGTTLPARQIRVEWLTGRVAVTDAP